MTKPIALTQREAREWLRDAAATVPADQAIMEVGVYQGSSLLQLALGAKEGHGARVYGVDTWGIRRAYPGRPHMRARYGDANLAVALRALSQAQVIATLIRDYSVTAASYYDGPLIGLLFIDAEHTEAAVHADWEAWEPHLAPEALVAFDDYWPEKFPGVVAAVDAILPWKPEIEGDRLAWARLG